MSTGAAEQSKEVARKLALDMSAEEIISIVRQQPPCDSEEWAVSGCLYPENAPLLYIKYGDNEERCRDAEARSHQFAYKELQKVPQYQRQGIYVPELYRVINLPKETVMLMEYVEGHTLKTIYRDWDAFEKDSEKYYTKIERAIRLFLTFPVPDDAPPGPVGGGIIKHPLFQGYLAPIVYESVELLQRHINKVCEAAA